ncbi:MULTISPECIES: type III secretion system protein SctP [Xanthomonas]|uniref:HpaC protein n=3 Tax=Xanthomonas TaxID=338 RepID=A0A7Z7J5X9_XANCH|nr:MULTISPECIES: type III secretion system protein SctP [Xanthomonas]ATS37426.1 type III secretion system protein SctP [Xanthomonas citri pv. phaseoli var. fuscans]ATS43763.1 type III secretion system protein SctP [Xanthomonas citri pv. phaseoli var. fuscans]ATS45428.1 type III secretion system protein SctP [Xanthomonas citri pv. phaseoli var. fuscans]ATS50185.1 type III secretion system protein SctP [Xanthomonas citri pv. phaseoli var. fuscans]ATS55920.1 type III secretion system protein SctP
MRKPPLRHVRILPVSGALQRPAAPATPARSAQRSSFLQLRQRLRNAQLALPCMVLPPQCDEDRPEPDAEESFTEAHDSAPVQTDPPLRSDGPKHQEPSQGNDNGAVGRQIATEWIRTQRAQMAIDRIALRVAEFCNAQPVRSAGSWEAWLDIDQEVVAQTTLFLRLSPDQLSLRFNTSSPDAREVLWCGRQRLEAALASTLSSTLQISIEVV